MKMRIALIMCMLLLGFNIVSAVSIKDVSSSPKEVAPGEIVDITLKIENIFNYDVTNLRVQFDLSGENVPFAPHESSSEKFLDELSKNDDEKFEFELVVLPSTATGIYKIPVSIKYNYEDSNGTAQDGEKEGLISIIVNSEPKLKVSLEDSVVLVKGRENILGLKIVNSGLADVKFLYVKAGDVSGLKFLGEKEQYIGDIDSDDFDSVDYKVVVNSDSSGSINLPVTLTFLDSTNKEFEETSNILLHTYSLKEAQGLGLVEKPKIILPIIVSLLIIGYIAYRVLKKRKLKKKRK